MRTEKEIRERIKASQEAFKVHLREEYYQLCVYDRNWRDALRWVLEN